MNNKVMFSSKKEDWETPQDFFDKLNEEFHFTLDAAALLENAKCANYFAKEQDGLAKSWGGASRVAQPAIRALYNRIMGKESIRRASANRMYSCHAVARTHRYDMVSQLHTRQS